MYTAGRSLQSPKFHRWGLCLMKGDSLCHSALCIADRPIPVDEWPTGTLFLLLCAVERRTPLSGIYYLCRIQKQIQDLTLKDSKPRWSNRIHSSLKRDNSPLAYSRMPRLTFGNPMATPWLLFLYAVNWFIVCRERFRMNSPLKYKCWFSTPYIFTNWIIVSKL